MQGRVDEEKENKKKEEKEFRLCPYSAWKKM